MPTRVIGIDLGTTNCALAFVGSEDAVEVYEIPQLTNPSEVRAEPLLPSSLYIAAPKEFPAGSLELPWEANPPCIVGALAQKRGVENASRLVSSAKSWLSHGGVDRTAALLPVAAPEGVEKLSPVEASRQYLEHLRHAYPEFDAHQVLITVPASFDAVARELTLEAARLAGYKDVVLLEEPQAAFYAWIERHPGWREMVSAGDVILVIDVGGGTTDFSLIAVTDQAGSLALERIAVGEHILLGGDNIDLALARSVEQELAAKGTKLDAMQLHALWQRCRVAKEKLLEPGAKQAEEPVTILGRGTGLVGGTIKAKLVRKTLEQILLEGFLPAIPATEMPQQARRSALSEVGLPYANDAGITRHLARFLSQQKAAPTHVLFNGGVLRAPLVRERLLAVLNSWLEKPAKALEGEDLMHAVARGAAYYGLTRQEKGVRIRGGVPRTYYVGVESSMPAVPGMPTPVKALTVAPFGMEEGSSVKMPATEFGLITGEPAEFRFFSSVTRKQDQAGEMIEDFDLEELAPVEVTLPADAAGTVRVTLEADVTETGVLQLWCVARDGRRWKLEFNVRERAA